MNFIKNVLFGAVIGLANIIPGVSGGTMMVVMGVFDKIIFAISNLRKEFKKSVIYLFPIVLGAGAAILLLSGVITWLLGNFYMATNFFFIGVVLGSIPMIWKKATEEKFRILNLIPFFLTLAIMLCTTFFTPDVTETVIRQLDVFSTLKLVLCSAVAAFCMIIPGISGSFMMLMLGVYETITTAISELNILVLIPIGVGVLIGILFGSKLIKLMIQKFPGATYFAILGFVIGSVPAIFDKIRLENAFTGGLQLVIGIIVLLLGGFISYVFSDEALKEKLLKRTKTKA